VYLESYDDPQQLIRLIVVTFQSTLPATTATTAATAIKFATLERHFLLESLTDEK